MTSATEAKLCREAEVCYSTMNLVCDYDAWHEEEEPVTIEMILDNMQKNVSNAKDIIRQSLRALSSRGEEECGCGEALKNCIITDPTLMPPETKKRLRLIIEKYVKF